jgi:amidase
MSSSLWSLDAVTVVELLRRTEVTPVEVLDAIEERVAAIDPLVNALPTRCFERARAKLARAKHLQTTPLAGIPIPIKDSYAVAGVRTTFGSLAFEHNVPDGSDYLVEAIELAGGTIYAKSNTPEFEAGANTFNEVFGHTLNPWETTRSAAGSSGGAAVAVATGMAHIAQGSDFACSLRYPASFCGVVGLRPTPGLIPQGPSPLPWQSLSVIGPLARNVADTGLALAAMRRFDPRDPLSRPLADEDYAAAARQPRPPHRFAYSRDLGVACVSAQVGAIVEAAISKLERAGAEVANAHPDLSRADAGFRPLRAFQFAAGRADLIDSPQRQRLKPEVVWNIEEGLRLAVRDLVAAERERAGTRASMLAFLDRYEFLISPTAPVEPFSVMDRYVSRIGEVQMETYLDWMILGYAVSVTGCPAISIPCGFSRHGLPIGLQIIGRPCSEEALLSLAAWCEAVLGVTLAKPIDPKNSTGH